MTASIRAAAFFIDRAGCRCASEKTPPSAPRTLPGWIDSLPATEERCGMVPMKRCGTSAGYITGETSWSTVA